MSGTRAGSLKARDKNLASDPDFYKKLGSRGGSAKVPKGFAINGRASEAGKIGGKRSKRGSKLVKIEPHPSYKKTAQTTFEKKTYHYPAQTIKPELDDMMSQTTTKKPTIRQRIKEFFT